jgi:flagellar motor switch protein FliM
MNFEVGSILNLNKSITNELIVKIEDLPKFKGLPGFSQGNQSVKISKVLE